MVFLPSHHCMINSALPPLVHLPLSPNRYLQQTVKRSHKLQLRKMTVSRLRRVRAADVAAEGSEASVGGIGDSVAESAVRIVAVVIAASSEVVIAVASVAEGVSGGVMVNVVVDAVADVVSDLVLYHASVTDARNRRL